MSRRETRDLEKLAHLMDEQFVGPFGWRFGWDGIIGLVPVIGDFLTNSVSAYIMFRGAQLGCPASVLVRMGVNLAIENIVDFIPVFGALFDFVWKANIMNLKLIERHLADPGTTRVRSRAWLGGIVALLVVIVGAGVAGAVWVLIAIIHWINAHTGANF